MYNRRMDMTGERVVQGAAAMRSFASEFVAGLSPRTAGATIIALSGDLGAGKTTFAQGIAQALGVQESVSSPTFVLENIYPLEGQKWHRLVHIDAYRLEGAAELAPLGWEGLTADSSNLVIIEWPEQVAGAIPPAAVTIRLSDAGGSARRVIIAQS
jgi:tRNA threonylcarbamoyl adenosine modification protein YjeE